MAVKPIPDGYHAVTPYLIVKGGAAAIEFYKKALDAEVTTLMRFGEAPEGGGKPENADKVMHSSLKIGSTVVMASDGYCTGKTSFGGTHLALAAASEAEAQRRFAALSDGGQVVMPLSKTFFSAGFGMVTDRFGVPWMIVVD